MPKEKCEFTVTENELCEIIGSWENLLLACNYISDHPEYFGLLMKVALNDSTERSWRASWLVNKIQEKQPGLFEPYIDQVIDFIQQTSDNSKKREFLRLLSLYPVPEEKEAAMLDYCVRQLTSAGEPVSVRVHAMQILFNISEKEPDFKPELIHLIEHETGFHPSAGICSRGNRLLHKLYKQNSRAESKDKPDQ